MEGSLVEGSLCTNSPKWTYWLKTSYGRHNITGIQGWQIFRIFKNINLTSYFNSSSLSPRIGHGNNTGYLQSYHYVWPHACVERCFWYSHWPNFQDYWELLASLEQLLQAMQNRAIPSLNQSLWKNKSFSHSSFSLCAPGLTVKDIRSAFNLSRMCLRPSTITFSWLVNKIPFTKQRENKLLPLEGSSKDNDEIIPR